MAITGNLAEFSLPEFLRFIAQRQGTGLLSIHTPADPIQKEKLACIWMHKGRIVAAADRLDGKGLPSLISQRGWLSYQEIFRRVGSSTCSANTPIGIHLKNVGAISAEQLKLLFIVQVLHPVCALFKLATGEFVFDTMAALPNEEMTGFSMSAPAVTLLGLRVLRDWAPLANKLPAPTVVMSRAVSGKPQFQLDSQESQVWQLMNGQSLQAIAKQLQLPIHTVQQIAFRLNIADLVEEVPVVTPAVRPARELRSSHRWSFNNLMITSGIGLFRKTA